MNTVYRLSILISFFYQNIACSKLNTFIIYKITVHPPHYWEKREPSYSFQF